MSLRLFIGALVFLVSFAMSLAEPVRVVTSVAPVQYFVEQIGGEHVVVECLVPAGKNPHHFSPLPDQLRRITDAEVFFGVGMPFERTIRSKLQSHFHGIQVDLGSGNHVAEHGHESHMGDDHDGHDHGHESDPHGWWNPLEAVEYCESILLVLTELRPEQGEYFSRRYEIMTARLRQVDGEIMDALESRKGYTLPVYHPAWGHFTKRYQLVQAPIESGGEAPNARRLVEVIREIQNDKSIRTVVFDPFASPRLRKMIEKELQLPTPVIDPLSPDYFGTLLKLVQSINPNFVQKQTKP